MSGSSPSGVFSIQRAHVKALCTEFEIVYAEAGPPSGPVLIGIHGAPCTHNAFRGMIAKLVSAGYRVIIPNLPGNGVTEVDKKKVYNYSTPHKAAIVKGLIQTLHIDKIAMIFGHSMGCHIATNIAHNPPKEGAVQSLGLICSPGTTPHRILRPQVISRFLTTFLYWIASIPFIGRIFARMMSPIFVATGFRGRTPIAQVMSFYEAAHMDFPQFGIDANAVVQRRCPTLLISSSDDKLIEYSITENTIMHMGMRLKDIIYYCKGKRSQPHHQSKNESEELSRSVIFDDGSHFLINKYPESLAEEIILFLQSKSSL